VIQTEIGILLWVKPPNHKLSRDTVVGPRRVISHETVTRVVKAQFHYAIQPANNGIWL